MTTALCLEEEILTRTALAELHDFAHLWITPVIREQVWDRRDNPLTRLTRSIRKIGAAHRRPTVGYGVYAKVYDSELEDGFEYVHTSLIFDRLEQAQKALEYLSKRKAYFVICELRELQP